MQSSFVRIKSLAFQNFKVFSDYTFNFIDNDYRNFSCFYGPNGCGKSTVLNAIQMIFSKFDGYDATRIRTLLGKSVRHIDGDQTEGIYGDGNFLITAKMTSSVGDYDVLINKDGFISDHPDVIKSVVYRLCYSTRFDLDLNKFQLPREKWGVFKDLYESVTGFTIEEKEDDFMLNQSSDPLLNELLRKYVLDFYINKPNEKITVKECSAGEKKIVASFATLLNKEITPQIILIDNVEMHVEASRHINLIESLVRSFPDSQIFVTTHSQQIIKNYKNKKSLYDLRLARASELIIAQPWRLYLSDEVNDALLKLEAVSIRKDEYNRLKCRGEDIIGALMGEDGCDHYEKDGMVMKERLMIDDFFENVMKLVIQNLLEYYK